MLVYQRVPTKRGWLPAPGFLSSLFYHSHKPHSASSAELQLVKPGPVWTRQVSAPAAAIRKSNFQDPSQTKQEMTENGRCLWSNSSLGTAVCCSLGLIVVTQHHFLESGRVHHTSTLVAIQASLIVVPGWVPSHRRLKQPNMFRDMKWGSGISSPISLVEM